MLKANKPIGLYPLKQSETLDAQAAEATYAEIKDRFPKLNIGIVHGRMKADEKQSVMQQFKNYEICY